MEASSRLDSGCAVSRYRSNAPQADNPDLYGKREHCARGVLAEGPDQRGPPREADCCQIRDQNRYTTSDRIDTGPVTMTWTASTLAATWSLAHRNSKPSISRCTMIAARATGPHHRPCSQALHQALGGSPQSAPSARSLFGDVDPRGPPCPPRGVPSHKNTGHGLELSTLPTALRPGGARPIRRLTVRGSVLRVVVRRFGVRGAAAGRRLPGVCPPTVRR